MTHSYVSKVSWWVAYWTGCLGLWGTGFAYASPTSTCTALVKQQQFDLAGQCFGRLAQTIQISTQTNVIQRKLKGLYLQNAATAYLNFAKSQPKIHVASFYYEKAAEALKQSLDERLCTTKYQCNQWKSSLWDATQKIGYVNVTFLQTSPRPLPLKLKGYLFKASQTLTDKWLLKLRPGTYTLTIQTPAGATKTLSFELKPNEQILKNLSEYAVLPPPKPPAPPKIPIGVWVLGGLGIGVIGAGASLLIVGSIALGSSDKLHQQLINIANERLGNGTHKEFVASTEFSKYASDVVQFQAQRNAGMALSSGGWVVGGVGAAMVVGAVVWAIVARKANAPAKATALPPSAAFVKAEGRLFLPLYLVLERR